MAQPYGDEVAAYRTENGRGEKQLVICDRMDPRAWLQSDTYEPVIR